MMIENSPKQYDPALFEETVNSQWIQSKAFSANPDSPRDKFCMVIPPPNVTSALHLGHALNNTLQDVLIRYHRMCGKETLWMPGTDHAGIATQTVVEKRILEEEGKRRTDFDRDDFVARIQDWKDEYEARILEQLKRMGCSCDWDRTRFTMDDVCANAVRENFYRLFEDGLIYRGKKLVNWDPATQTVLADDEVEHEEIQGHFWYLTYPLVEAVDINGEMVTHVTVGTTRPETMLGDTAVAMNPSDPRAKQLVGRQVRLPITDRIVPIIADEHVVLPDPDSDDEKAKYSTGFLKVTPAHDPDDYRIGMNHDLPMINIMAPDGTISMDHGWSETGEKAGENLAPLLGLDRFKARITVVEWFKNHDLLSEIRDYTHSVGHSYRSHVPIEPYLSDQWYIAVKKPVDRLADKFGSGMLEGTDIPANSLAGLALAPLLDGSLTFVPERYARTYQTWLENLRDWPISRQLWWGHRIPVWRGTEPPRESDISYQVNCEDGEDVTYVCVPPGHEEIEKKLEDAEFVRDEDVLDTWFSSALWPFSTMGWPEETPLMRKFYPGDVLSTAREIITLWVSRMVMMGQYCVGDIPFTEVFIHAMIQDGQGRKMSKSLGNGVDPLEVIETHGTDAMRYALVSMTTQTQDVRMPLEKMTLPDGREVNSSPKFDIGRNLCNKLWNASRFAMGNLEDVPAWKDIAPDANLSDRWILSRLNKAVQNAAASIKSYKFNDYGGDLYHFMWDDFCDWYLEIAKSRIAGGDNTPKAVIAHCLDTLLRLMHPMMPFITEAIWKNLNNIAPVRGPDEKEVSDMLIRSSWPQCDEKAIDSDAEEKFDLLTGLVRQIRNVRKQNNIPPGTKMNALVEANEQSASSNIIQDNQFVITQLANLGDMTFSGEKTTQPEKSAAVIIRDIRLYLLDVVDTQAEKSRLQKEIDRLSNGIRGAEAKLSNDNFVSRAPEEVVLREKQRLVEMKRELESAEEAFRKLS